MCRRFLCNRIRIKENRQRERRLFERLLVADVVKDLFTGGDHVELLAGKLLQVLGIVGLFERGGEGIVLALLLLELRGKGLLFGLSAADLLPEVQKVRADEKQQSLPFVPRRAGNAAPTVCNFLL